SANKLVKWMGFAPSASSEAHSEEEIRVILSESLESGKINNSEYSYVNRIFEFDERMAKEIMVPRTDMVCLYADQPCKEMVKIMKLEQYTRFPVAQGGKDQIIGILNTKQFFLHYDSDCELDIMT